MNEWILAATIVLPCPGTTLSVDVVAGGLAIMKERLSILDLYWAAELTPSIHPSQTSPCEKSKPLLT